MYIQYGLLMYANSLSEKLSKCVWDATFKTILRNDDLLSFEHKILVSKETLKLGNSNEVLLQLHKNVYSPVKIWYV